MLTCMRRIPSLCSALENCRQVVQSAMGFSDSVMAKTFGFSQFASKFQKNAVLVTETIKILLYLKERTVVEKNLSKYRDRILKISGLESDMVDRFLGFGKLASQLKPEVVSVLIDQINRMNCGSEFEFVIEKKEEKEKKTEEVGWVLLEDCQPMVLYSTLSEAYEEGIRLHKIEGSTVYMCRFDNLILINSSLDNDALITGGDTTRASDGGDETVSGLEMSSTERTTERLCQQKLVEESDNRLAEELFMGVTSEENQANLAPKSADQPVFEMHKNLPTYPMFAQYDTEGKWCLLVNKEQVGLYRTYNEACEEGIRRKINDRMLICCVYCVDDEIPAYSFLDENY